MSELISAGVGPFGNAQDPDIVSCAVCGDPVQHVSKFMVEREIIHKACFICAFCDARLQVGYCVQELALYNRYGPCWYCSLICAHRPLAEKEAKLKENGVEVRQPSTRRPKAKSGQATGINITPAGTTPNEAPISPVEAVAQKQPENPPMEIDNVATLEGEIGKEVEGNGTGNDGPEIEAEEIVAEEMPKNVKQNGQKAAEATAPELIQEGVVEASKNEGEEGGAMQGDGEEMEAEEVAKTTPAKEPTPPKSEEGNDVQQYGNLEVTPIEGGEIEQEQKMASAAVDGEEVIPPATPTKESKPVAMDAYENKYRLQMKKKK